MNRDNIVEWSIVFETKNSPISPYTTRPKVDLKYLLSNAASKQIATVAFLSIYLCLLSLSEIVQAAQQKRQYCSLLPMVKTQDII
ncbi:hypothetical protein J1N35_025929 [Gossypium stocksii]|uniref:Uncharacterized protein n=1 Tax=Gossypium stocksii TaxID=47602 RepID=A0A9D3V795_9ROSI|nr:hypothetical protein J1N35_025929 [Gossypium stocksii]